MTSLRRTRLQHLSTGFEWNGRGFIALPPGAKVQTNTWGNPPDTVRCKSPAQARALAKRGGRVEQTVSRRCAWCDWREEQKIMYRTVVTDAGVGTVPDGTAEAIIEWLGWAHTFYCPGTFGVPADDLRTIPLYGGIGVTQFPDWEGLAYEREGAAGIEFERDFQAQARERRP